MQFHRSYKYAETFLSWAYIYRERTRATLIFVIKPRAYETQIYSNNDIPDKRLNSAAVAHYTYFASILPTIDKEYIIRLYLLCSLRGEGRD